MNNGLFTYLAALLLFGSNGIIASAIALPSSDIVLLRTFLGALSLVTILAITQRHKLQAPSRLREAAALLLSGAALGASWIFLFRAYQTIGVGVSSLLYYCGPIIVMALSPLIFGEKLTGGKIAGLSPSPAAPSSSRHKVWAAICPLRVSLAASSRPSATH